MAPAIFFYHIAMRSPPELAAPHAVFPEVSRVGGWQAAPIAALQIDGSGGPDDPCSRRLPRRNMKITMKRPTISVKILAIDKYPQFMWKDICGWVPNLHQSFAVNIAIITSLNIM
jgi:hypothetical protein